MKIAIAGAGAVGGFFGALLKKAGHDVIFLARGKHLDAMETNGLEVTANGESFTITSEFTNDIESFSDADLILFCVKATDTKEVAEQIASLNNEKPIILTLQNGVDNEEILANIFGEERILSAATYVSSHVEKPGVINQDGVVFLVIGALHESLVPFRNQVAELFNGAGIETRTNDNIMRSKWKKLLWNVTYNPLAALTKATVGDILDHPELRLTAEKVCREVMDIAEKNGTPLDEDMFTRTFASSDSARGHQPSMLQDRLNGKRMEIESLVGFLVKKGRELGVETPVLQTIYSSLLHIDSRIQS